MQTKFILAMSFSLAVAQPSVAQPSVGRRVHSQPADKVRPFKIADFPRAAARIDFFEERVNSPRVEDREAVVSEAAGRWQALDKETVALLKRLMRQDPDPEVRGAAVRKLHEAWVALQPEELPAVFNGYHRGQVLDRGRKDLCDDLVREVRGGGVEAGYAAYALGLLRCRQAARELRNLAESKNEFVRYSAGRALMECGDPENAEPILKTLMNQPVPPGAAIGAIVDPHYQALAARAYMELGPAQKKAGIRRLIDLMKELESWQDINAPGRLDTARRMLAMVSGRFFPSHHEAGAWYAGAVQHDK